MKQFLKYWLSGGVYFWAGYLIFSIFYGIFKLDWFASKIIADILGLTINYIIQKKWVFNEKTSSASSKSLQRYIYTGAIGFILDYLIIWALKSIGITPYIGFFISSLFFTFWNYLFYKFYVFSTRHKNVRK